MKLRLTVTVFLLTAALLLFSMAVSGQETRYKPCGINLTSLSKTSGVPGDTFEMYGTWGTKQGAKIPCINKGGMNRLIVLSWSNSVIKVKIPAGLTPGTYKVGVYCNDLSLGGSYSSGWKDFIIKEAGGTDDIDITDIYLDDKCRIWIKHTNNGTNTLNIVLRERVWVDGRMVDDSTETFALAPGAWISHGVGANPGVIISGRANVRAQIDVDNTLREINERNNIMTKLLKCGRPMIKKPLIMNKRTVKK
jgi:hypothetical protein